MLEQHLGCRARGQVQLSMWDTKRQASVEGMVDGHHPDTQMGLVCLPNFMDGLVFVVHVGKDTIHCAFGIVKYMIYY